ncbi:hypothetical protein BGZ81_002165 [Podila clonocystis]|nr:hypothetical protein BGZ81_002165 [Podila clonocystis]
MEMAASRIRTVAYYALLSRLAIWAIAVASHALIQDYDSALDLILPIETVSQRMFKSIFGVFLRWDAFYFVHIAENGYAFEQAHAFFPLLPIFMRLVANTVLAPLSLVMTYQQQLVLAGVLVANGSFIIAAVQLYCLSNTLFGNERFSFLSALLYILTPSGIFMSAIYTESLFAAISFTGMIFTAQKRYLLAAILFSLSSTARSNGVLYAGYFVYDLVIQMDLSKPTMQKLAVLVKTAALCAISWVGFLAVQAYGYYLYCSEDHSNVYMRPWCLAKPPLLYTFVQSFYWNVGFLRYYEIKQIPNFLMAAPMITLSAVGIYSYILHDTRRSLTLGRDSTYAGRSQTPPFMSQAMFPHIVLWAVLLLSNITTMHIQIITRAFSCLPPVYWFAAHQFGDKAYGLRAGYARPVTTFFVMYGLIGVILFANFFPPA